MRRASMIEGMLNQDIHLGLGDDHHFVLELSNKPLPAPAPTAADLWAATKQA